MNTKIRRIAFCCALMLALTPLCVRAESSPSYANAAPVDGARMQMRSQMGRYNVDRSVLTDQQKQVYDKALSDYAVIEDQALAELVAAGDVTQEEVDRFVQMRTSQGAMASLEMDKWTSDQQEAFQSAMMAQGEDRASAFAALVESGQLTQAQADAFAGMNTFVGRRVDADALPPQDGQGAGNFVGNGDLPSSDNLGDMPGGPVIQAGNTDIWSEIESREQTESILKALQTIQDAQQCFFDTLSGAGIQMMS